MATVEGSNKHTCLATIGTQKERRVGHDEEKIYDYIMWISHKEKKKFTCYAYQISQRFLHSQLENLFFFFFCI